MHAYLHACIHAHVYMVHAYVHMQVLLGHGAHALWYWGRGPDGTPTAQLPVNLGSARQFPESILTQPIAMATYHRTWLLLQAHAEVVAALASARRTVWLLLSMPSYYASSAHAMAIYNALEALASLGTPFGFVSTDGNGTHSLADVLADLPASDWLIAPGCTHVDLHTSTALLAWMRARGDSHLVAMGKADVGELCAYDEKGGRRADGSAAMLRQMVRFFTHEKEHTNPIRPSDPMP